METFKLDDVGLCQDLKEVLYIRHMYVLYMTARQQSMNYNSQYAKIAVEEFAT
jgi:hypothetical protein